MAALLLPTRLYGASTGFPSASTPTNFGREVVAREVPMRTDLSDGPAQSCRFRECSR
jgi:hypothetical protein